MIKRLGSPGICAQLLSTSSWRNEMGMFTLQIGNQDWSFLFYINIVTVFYICLLIEFWRFLNFRSEPHLISGLATSQGATRKSTYQLFSRDFWSWYITIGHKIRFRVPRTSLKNQVNKQIRNNNKWKWFKVLRTNWPEK